MTVSAVSPAAPGPRALEREFLSCLLAPDGRRARELVEGGLAAGTPADTLYLEVIAPAMHEVGRRWETAQISVAQEHLATQITQTVIAALGLRLAGGVQVGAGRTAVVASTPGERHALAGQMVGDFLESQGWAVLGLGADTPAPELVGLVAERGPDLVALSTSLPAHLLSVTRTCELLRGLSRPPFVVVGGRAYGSSSERARVVGADAFAADPRSLLELLARRYGGRPRALRSGPPWRRPR